MRQFLDAPLCAAQEPPMIKKILKVVAVILAIALLVPLLSLLSAKLYYWNIVRQTPGKLSVPVQAGALGAKVNVFSGTGGWFYLCAHNNPCAMTPFGMVRLAPDTASMVLDKNGLNTSGYYYGDNKLLGFSHTRFVGTGMHEGCNLRVLPTVASRAGELLGLPREKRWVRFSHGKETAFPGYYAVELPQDDILAEMTATPHAGFHRYTFKKDESPHIILDVSGALDNRVLDGYLAIAPEKNEVSGMVKVHGGAGTHGGMDLHFVGRFSRPFESYATWKGKQVQPGNRESAGLDIGADLSFARDAANPTVEFQMAISYVSAANARLNFDAEAAKASFDDVAKAAREAWETRLAAIQITGGTNTQQRIFYTALFRCFQMPTRFADVNGEYIGFDQQVHRQEGFQYYTDFSLWDTFRTTHPLYTLIAPRDQRDMMVSLIEMAKIDKGLPRWPAGTRDTGSMFGTPSDVAVSEAYLKGIRDIDIETAYQAMCQTALRGRAPDSNAGCRDGLDLYLQHHYCPADKIGEAVSRTLEYAWEDNSISLLANALGKKEDAALFAEHAQYYRNTWNPATQYFQPRDSRGAFMEFKPLRLTYFDEIHKKKYAEAYVEGSALQWRWGVPFDPEGLIPLFKSPEYFTSELESYFEKTTGYVLGAWQPGPYYWHGNEPYVHAPYLFNHVGRPDLTQKWVRWICDNMHADDYIGLAGNDDAATLSAWYVFNALGFYPIAGTTRYELAAPLFDKAEVQLGANKLTVIAENQAPKNCYVQSVALNGTPLDRTYINHDEIANGGTLKFVLGPNPAPRK
jgi:predicted alpha-1,2-mannosidase